MTGRETYRSATADLARAMYLTLIPVLLAIAGSLISASVTHRRHLSGPPLPFAAACLVMAAVSGRLSLTALKVSDDSVRIVNWLRTYDIPRVPGLTFAFGYDVPNANVLFRDTTHVLLRVNAERSINVAALTLGRTRIGVDEMHQIVEKLNARMRTWDTTTTPL